MRHTSLLLYIFKKWIWYKMKLALRKRPSGLTTNNALQRKDIAKSASNDHDNGYFRPTITISFQILQIPMGTNPPFPSRPWLISRHHHHPDPFWHRVPMQLLSDESDIAFSVEEAVVRDEACEAKLGVSCQICGAGKCTTRGWRAEIVHNMIKCFKTGKKAYLVHCPDESFHPPMF